MTEKKKVHIGVLKVFNHRSVCVVHVQLQQLFWSLLLSQSLDLFRLLLFHVCVFCPNEFGCDKQIQAAKTPPFGPGESARRPGTNTNQVAT